MEEDARVMSSAGTLQVLTFSSGHSHGVTKKPLPSGLYLSPRKTMMLLLSASIYAGAVTDRPYSTVPPVNLDLPMAHTLDDRPNTYLY